MSRNLLDMIQDSQVITIGIAETKSLNVNIKKGVQWNLHFMYLCLKFSLTCYSCSMIIQIFVCLFFQGAFPDFLEFFSCIHLNWDQAVKKKPN